MMTLYRALTLIRFDGRRSQPGESIELDDAQELLDVCAVEPVDGEVLEGSGDPVADIVALAEQLDDADLVQVMHRCGQIAFEQRGIDIDDAHGMVASAEKAAGALDPASPSTTAEDPAGGDPDPTPDTGDPTRNDGTDAGGGEGLTREQRILAAMANLDPEKKSDFTRSGKPQISALEKRAQLTDITGTERDELWAQWQASQNG